MCPSRKRLIASISLAIYIAVAVLGQGLHLFAHTDACHGVHASAASGGCCCHVASEAPFANVALANTAVANVADYGHATFRNSSSDHGCQDCLICQQLSQLQAGKQTFLTPNFLARLVVRTTLSNQHTATDQPIGLFDARGPPVQA